MGIISKIKGRAETIKGKVQDNELVKIHKDIKEDIKNGRLTDVIRCDESEYLIWKWHPKESNPNNNRRQNEIRYGSSLRVKDGSVAVFVYRQSDGTMQDYIEGPFDEILKTINLPVLSTVLGHIWNGGSPFQAEVYFINLAKIIQTKFAIPFFDVYDPRFVDFGVPVAVRGTVSFKIKDYREFIKLHRLDSFNLDDFQKQIRDAVNRYAKDVVANAPARNGIPVVQIESKIAQINDVIEYDLSERLRETFGVEASGVDISAIEIDKSSDGYKHIMSITRDVTSSKVKAETEDYIERLRISREEGQYAAHKQTQSSNIGAFQVEKQTEVGVAGAEALGQMGANGAGTVDIGGNGNGNSGFNPAAMMASMAVGGVVGQSIAGTMNSAMSGMGQQQTDSTPPPIPETAYNVAADGKSTGPYNISTLSQMAQSGIIDAKTLVWKPGMSNWASISDIPELSEVVTSIPPQMP